MPDSTARLVPRRDFGQKKSRGPFQEPREINAEYNNKSPRRCQAKKLGMSRTAQASRLE
jgi:hypothetical protein